MPLDVIIFPNRELIQVPADRLSIRLKMPGAAPLVQPYADYQAINNFTLLNWLMRPPLSDEEIRLMPADEVIGTYYSIHVFDKKCEFKRNPTISGGLPDVLAQPHEENLQRRIYALRSDLRAITYQGKTYRILLDPDMLEQPDCGATGATLIAQALVVGVFSLGIGGLGVFAALAVNAAQAAQTVYSQVQSARESNRAVGLVGELSTGMDLAKQLLPNPTPTPALIASLRQQYADWQQKVAWANANATKVNVQWIHMYDAALLITAVGNTNSYLPYQFDGASYMARWKPFIKFFWSDYVAQLVATGGQVPAGQPAAVATTDDQTALAGAGLLLLLLL